MNRREFLHGAAAIASLKGVSATLDRLRSTEIAFTFDDPTTVGGANLKWNELNDRILAALAKHRIKSVLFVCGKRVDSSAGQQLIATWDHQGHLIGNHSYSHLFFDENEKVTLAEFQADALKNEPVIQGYDHFTKHSAIRSLRKAIQSRSGMECVRS